MNRKEFYARRRVYRIMRGQDDYEYEHCPSQESGKYWSGMDKFDPSQRSHWEYINGAVYANASLKYLVRAGHTTKEAFMAEATELFKKRHPKVKLP